MKGIRKSIAYTNNFRRFPVIFILMLILCGLFSSCKTTYSFDFQPKKPARFVFQGNSLINRIQSDYPLKEEEKIIKGTLSQLTKLGSKFDYIGQVKEFYNIPEPIDYVPQPLIMDTLYKDFGYKYLINIHSVVNEYRVGSWAIGEQDPDHHVIVDITVYETDTHRMKYRQEVMLHEKWDYTKMKITMKNPGGFC